MTITTTDIARDGFREAEVRKATDVEVEVYWPGGLAPVTIVVPEIDFSSLFDDGDRYTEDQIETLQEIASDEGEKIGREKTLDRLSDKLDALDVVPDEAKVAFRALIEEAGQ